MREEFLHHLWKYRNFNSNIQFTSSGQRVEIIHPGKHNHDAGPDFFNARIKIDDLEWAGNVEIHVKSSDWVSHGHSSDRAYDSVILHVVYSDDKPVKLKGLTLPTLALKGCFDISSIEKYKALRTTNSFVPCSSILNMNKLAKVLINNYIERLYVEKLEYKSLVISNLLYSNEGDWEETYYQLLARSFGQGKNRVPFELLAKATPLYILEELSDDMNSLEALFLGQAGFLNDKSGDSYSVMLSKLYGVLRTKYELEPIDKHLWKYSRLRPGNFPTLRIAQLARLCLNSRVNFKSLISVMDIGTLFKRFNIRASEYWATHSKLGRISSTRSTNLGHSSIKGIIINAIVPLLFEYGRVYEKQEIKDQALALMRQVGAERNTLLLEWKRLGFSVGSAIESQALIHLKTTYCDHKKCLSCTIGAAILK